MVNNFYDKVAKKFGKYHTGAKYITEYPNDEPEKVFKEKLIRLSGKDKITLDVGCADGRFTLSISSYFQKVVAIDMSKGMLEAANVLRKQKGIENVDFQYMDAHTIRYPNKSFDIIYSRRGPTDYPEFYRLLKPERYYLEINIGERDTQEIKEVFGRGQNFGEWDGSTLEKNKKKILDTGFKIIFAQDYLYNEYYSSYEDLDLFLQGVPIFEDFDSEKDKKFLEKYVAEFKTEQGIKFPRHRVVIVTKKS